MTTRTPPVRLPDPERVRNRLAALDDEARLLRRLLRLVLRYHLATGRPSGRSESAPGATRG